MIPPFRDPLTTLIFTNCSPIWSWWHCSTGRNGTGAAPRPMCREIELRQPQSGSSSDCVTSVCGRRQVASAR